MRIGQSSYVYIFYSSVGVSCVYVCVLVIILLLAIQWNVCILPSAFKGFSSFATLHIMFELMGECFPSVRNVRNVVRSSDVRITFS